MTPQLLPRLYREGAGPPLMLLHPLGMDRALWQIAAAGLAGRCELITCDLPGHGEAMAPAGGWTIAEAAGGLAQALDAEGLRRVAVGGFSIGGLIAQQLAADRPDLVSRLVLISTTHRYTDGQRALWTNLAAQARGGALAAFAPQLLHVWFSAAAIAQSLPAVDYVRGRYAKVDPEGFAQACEVLAAADLTSLTKRIRAPTLVVSGDDDLPSFAEAARRFAATVADSRIVEIPGGRHAACLEYPTLFADHASAFLEL